VAPRSGQLKYSSAPLSDEAGQVRDRSSAVHRARELPLMAGGRTR
jgi:hypothetical protein